MVQAYRLVGKRIVEEEQQGEAKAGYGKGLLKKLSEELGKEFGKGFSVVNLQNMRLFYLQYSIQQTVSVKLDSTLISDTLSRKLQIPEFKLSWFPLPLAQECFSLLEKLRKSGAISCQTGSRNGDRRGRGKGDGDDEIKNG